MSAREDPFRDPATRHPMRNRAANLRTKILDFRGFDSSRILILRSGIPMSRGDFPEALNQLILVWVILVGRLKVLRHRPGAYLAAPRWELTCRSRDPCGTRRSTRAGILSMVVQSVSVVFRFAALPFWRCARFFHFLLSVLPFQPERRFENRVLWGHAALMYGNDVHQS